jgi:hypothetical protein
MMRAEMMRQARSTVQVTFSEYLKIRTPDAQILIFEGKHCPTFYIGRVATLLEGRKIGQLVARGKKNVLELKELIERNCSTKNDRALFFVDRDFDRHPEPGEFDDVYVTRGYAIENECIHWPIIESFLRANFDIADADDESAIESLKNDFERVAGFYANAMKSVHRMIFVCQRNSIRCLPGDDAVRFLEVNFSTHAVNTRFTSLEELASLLQVPPDQQPLAISKMPLAADFERLDWRLQWRGKYHFDFVRRFLIWAAAARIAGAAPFRRSAKPVVDPAHPSLLGSVFACVPTPLCLIDFVRVQTGKQKLS